MPNPDLSIVLRQTRSALTDLTQQLRTARSAAQSTVRQASQCVNGVCSLTPRGAGAPARQSAAGPGVPDSGLTTSDSRLAAGAFSPAAFSAGLAGDWRRALQSTLQSVLRGAASQFAGSLSRGVGGGLFGGLLGGVVSGGLGLLFSRLFAKREAVSVDNSLRHELLNFPRLASLDFASNPASRLLGGRAVARGPAFSVEVTYRNGAEDVVAAKVAHKLSDLNALRGVV